MGNARRPLAPDNTDLFTASAYAPRQHRVLILPKYLDEAGTDAKLHDEAEERGAYEILRHWSDLEKQGHLNKKETALDAEFLHKVFGKALGYSTVTESPDKYHLERNFTVKGVGVADGALGHFGTGLSPKPAVAIELKGAETNLDRDKSNGRTAVQQCWDYLNALPNCPWGIVSNFVSFRLYHRDKTSQAYQEFRLQDLRKPEVFAQFYCLFAAGAFMPGYAGQEPRALRLIKSTAERQRDVGNELYEAYSNSRHKLIDHLKSEQGKTLDRAIKIAQTILDRIIFIAFCEDRGLLSENCLRNTHDSISPHSRVTNPRWQNFLNLFGAIDRGVASDPFLKTGFNGGLFKHDPEIDDLQLDDRFTDFFKNVGTFDFRDEVNLEVLGQLFEKSIGELESVRSGGLFGEGNGSNGIAKPPKRKKAKPKNGVEQPAMQKSAERKRFGIYYTPPSFTEFIVRETLGTLIDEEQKAVRKTRHIRDVDLNSETPSLEVEGYWRECLARLRRFKVCDPACGSGAFLIQAFDYLYDRYREIIEGVAFHGLVAEKTLLADVSDWILTENLYGVDLSEQSVEITQLALWLRSAKNDRKLADLSHNIVRGNSLVTDPAVHDKAMRWADTFPKVFDEEPSANGEEAVGGFHAVIGNPPWERMKLQEREFFAHSAPAIAGAVSAADRRKSIRELETKNPELFELYVRALRNADSTLAHVRASGEFPLTAKGDINTYMLFAELARKIVAPYGRVGLLVPSGIATDNTTREFFNALMEKKGLAGLYDFENKLKVFPDVDGRFKFSVLLFGGSSRVYKDADFVFFAHSVADLKSRKRHIALTYKDMALVNPNTKTCPIFRTRRDAELTKEVYRNGAPVLIDHNRTKGGNPWGIKFIRMFDQTNDAELFIAPELLKEQGFKLTGNRWLKGEQTYLPLYEAKMIQAYDHRAASVVIKGENWMRQGQTEDTGLLAHQSPEILVQPRWWVAENEVDRVRGVTFQSAYLCFKDVTSPTNQRTVIAAMIPNVAVVNSAPLMLIGKGISPRRHCCLLGNMNSLVLDFFARQKVGGLHLNFFIVEQLPIFPPDRYEKLCPWDKSQTLEQWISDRVLKLTCTANDMMPLAKAAKFKPPVYKWDVEEREKLRAELDAAYFRLYGISRDDAEYILGTFQGLKDDAARQTLLNSQSQTQTILTAYDALKPMK